MLKPYMADFLINADIFSHYIKKSRCRIYGAGLFMKVCMNSISCLRR